MKIPNKDLIEKNKAPVYNLIYKIYEKLGCFNIPQYKFNKDKDNIVLKFFYVYEVAYAISCTVIIWSFNMFANKRVLINMKLVCC